jgi:oligopeptide/dipeptide ABC transporter ATP-binding protein
MEGRPSFVNDSLLSVQDLRIDFETEEGVLRAVRGIDFSIGRGEVLGLVGESGCGKSVTALSILRLVASPPGRVRAKGILFHGENLLALSPARMQKVRGDRISMIFQEPMTSLNPLYTVGDQIIEAITLHQSLRRGAAREKARFILEKVGIPDPTLRIQHYPYQLSGGMRQRVMIAIALSCRPELLIADEPTTALDVTIQAQILDLLERLRAEIDMAMLLITHNLALVRTSAHRLAIMYAGNIVESAPTRALFANPLHPYTQGLFDCIPRLKGKREVLRSIPGSLPSLLSPPEGCSFRARCGAAFELCGRKEPVLRESAPGHWVSCHLFHREGMVS